MKPTATRQAKVTDDNGVTRSKVPAPILKALGAKAGDYLTFEMGEAGCVMMRVLKKRTRKVKKIKK